MISEICRLLNIRAQKKLKRTKSERRLIARVREPAVRVRRLFLEFASERLSRWPLYSRYEPRFLQRLCLRSSQAPPQLRRDAFLLEETGISLPQSSCCPTIKDASSPPTCITSHTFTRPQPQPLFQPLPDRKTKHAFLRYPPQPRCHYCPDPRQ
jgi:hypothetical protein